MTKCYVIRPMEQGDIFQVAQIDREAFPGEWVFRTQSAYKQDLVNPSIRYLVVYEKGDAPESAPAAPQKLTWLRRPFASRRRIRTSDDIVGFSGFWMMLREAHIIAIGLKSNYRGYGLGEALLVATIDLAQTLDAYVITLEVRASNKIAQELYKKYGFREVGRRVKYYSSDGEDALIMASENIASVSYQASFKELKKAHSRAHREILFKVR